MNPVIKYVLTALLLLGSNLSIAGTHDYGRWNHQVEGSTTDLSNPWKACTTYHKSSSGNYGWYTTQHSGTQGQAGHRLWCNYYDLDNGVVTHYTNRSYITFGIVSSNVAPSCPAGTEYDGTATPKGCYTAVTCTAGENPVTSRFSEEQIKNGEAELTQHNGCIYEYSGPIDCRVGVDEQTYCDMEYRQTGDKATTQPESIPLNPAGELDPLPPTTDTRQTTSETETTSQTSETAPDGTVTDTTEQQTTETKNQGTVIWNEGNKTFVQTSDGALTVYETTNQTVTYPDGSSDVITTTNWTYTAPNVSTTEFNQQPPSYNSTTGKKGQDKSGSETTTQNYDAQGNKTGQTTTSTGPDAVDNDGEECTGPDCEQGEDPCGIEGYPACTVTVEDTSDDFPDELLAIETSKTELEQARQQVVDDLGNQSEDYGLSTITNFNVQTLVTNLLPLPQGVACSGISTTFLDAKVFTFEPCEDLIPLREVLAWVFFILTLYAVINIMLGRRLF